MLDFESFSLKSRKQYVDFTRALADQLHSIGKTLAVQISMSDPTYDASALASVADEVIVMIYDEHTEFGSPGPLAGQGWYELQMDAAFAAVPAGKLVISIGSYGYNWPHQGKGQELSVQEAWELLGGIVAPLRPGLRSIRPSATRTIAMGNPIRSGSWTGVTAYNQIGAALASRPAGLALWRLGTEDPSVWAVFGRGRLPDREALERVGVLNPGYDVLYKGQGEVLDVRGGTKAGLRRLGFSEKTNLITDQEIVTHCNRRSSIAGARAATR